MVVGCVYVPARVARIVSIMRNVNSVALRIHEALRLCDPSDDACSRLVTNWMTKPAMTGNAVVIDASAVGIGMEILMDVIRAYLQTCQIC